MAQTALIPRSELKILISCFYPLDQMKIFAEEDAMKTYMILMLHQNHGAYLGKCIPLMDILRSDLIQSLEEQSHNHMASANHVEKKFAYSKLLGGSVHLVPLPAVGVVVEATKKNFSQLMRIYPDYSVD